MSALLKSSPEKYIIEILEGPDKGAQFQVLPGSIRIGRGEDNDIILHDPKCSREHALLKISAQSIMIENLSQNNALNVDGENSNRAFISHNTKISLGNTVILFKRTLNTIEESPRPKLTSYHNNDDAKLKKNNKTKFYITVVFIALIFIYLISNNQNNITTTTNTLSLEEEIELSRKRQEDILREQTTQGKNSRQYLDAQASYMKGLRDYREGLYKSAMASFSATLAIYPEHPTARRYYDLSKLKLDEQIQFLLQEGNRHMSQNKFRLAMSSYKNVMLLIGDPKNKFYEEAKTKYNESYLLLKGAF